MIKAETDHPAYTKKEHPVEPSNDMNVVPGHRVKGKRQDTYRQKRKDLVFILFRVYPLACITDENTAREKQQLIEWVDIGDPLGSQIPVVLQYMKSKIKTLNDR